MKAILCFLFAALCFLFAAFLANSASAAEIPFRFQLKDINVPGQIIPHAGMYDLNNSGLILAAAYFNDGIKGIITNGKVKRNQTEIFDCSGYEQGKGLDLNDLSFTTFMEPFSISNKRRVVGYCSAADSVKSFMSGFIKGTNGLQTFDVPGATSTMAQGISPDARYVTGTFWELGKPACFLLDRQTKAMTKISFDPSANSTCYAVGNAGKILGEFWGGINGHGFFVYDNGTFTVPLPLFDEQGLGGYVAFDLNEDGAILGLFYDETGGHLFFWDDGQVFTITPPENWEIYNIGGWNTFGQFVGRVSIKVGVDEQCLINTPHANCNLYDEHGFIAAPERGALAGLR